MGWSSNTFGALVSNYPGGSRDNVVRYFDFVDTQLTQLNTCALRLSFALHHAIPGSMSEYSGTTFTTSSGLALARSSSRLAEHINAQSGWSHRVTRNPTGYVSPPGQGVMYWKGTTSDSYHIDLWDRDGHLDAANGRCMLWRPRPEDTEEVWYWQLDPPTEMIFGLHELGQGGSFR